MVDPHDRETAYQVAATISQMRSGGLGVHASLEMDGAIAEAVYTSLGLVVVLRETDEPSDWRRFNLRVLPNAWPASGANHRWHRGFLRYAKHLYGWVKALEPDVLAGFSLGGGAAQIIGSSLTIPTVCLGSPAALWQWRPEHIKGEAMIACWNGVGDRVCRLPPDWMRYRHVGRVHPVLIGEHRIEAYRRVLGG